jgi:hypothetical protein
VQADPEATVFVLHHANVGAVKLAVWTAQLNVDPLEPPLPAAQVASEVEVEQLAGAKITVTLARLVKA